MPVTSYIRKQGTIAGIINVVINSLITWLGHRRTGFVPLGGLVVDVAVTSILLSLLVSLFASAGVRHDFEAGRVRATGEPPEAGRALSRLPARWWALGLLIGLGVAVTATVVLRLLGALGLSGLPLAGFVAFMAVYTGLLGYAVTRWVILRQLAERQAGTAGTGG
ncbi:hypothetical protein ACFWFZ_17640 [Streptomyces sp. NPDC060232]|uniref:hypothetical protein n=1 Tax=Streptomyces sp. NPDC060232 TaxID=3347079 RepID=UPI0036647186